MIGVISHVVGRCSPSFALRWKSGVLELAFELLRMSVTNLGIFELSPRSHNNWDRICKLEPINNANVEQNVFSLSQRVLFWWRNGYLKQATASGYKCAFYSFGVSLEVRFSYGSRHLSVDLGK